MYFCKCKDCKKARRKGKILGTRIMGFWMKSWAYGKAGDEYVYYLGPVSDYVPFPKFQKGRKRKQRNKKMEIDE